MKKLEQNVLDILLEDARTEPEQIAVMLGKPVEEVMAAVAALEAGGTLVKYTVLVNPDRIEPAKVEAYIELRVSPSRTLGFDGIAEEIAAFPEVQSVFLMSGGYDFAVVVEGTTLKDVAMFVSEKLSSLDKIVATATHFILKRYKSGGVNLFPSGDEKRLPVHA